MSPEFSHGRRHERPPTPKQAIQAQVEKIFPTGTRPDTSEGNKEWYDERRGFTQLDLARVHKTPRGKERMREFFLAHQNPFDEEGNSEVTAYYFTVPDRPGRLEKFKAVFNRDVTGVDLRHPNLPGNTRVIQEGLRSQHQNWMSNNRAAHDPDTHNEIADLLRTYPPEDPEGGERPERRSRG